MAIKNNNTSLREIPNPSFYALYFSVAPEFQVTPQDKTVLEGQNISFHCSISGVPRPNVLWSFSGGSLPSHIVKHDNLFLYNVRNNPSYEGNYTCTGASVAGRTDYTASLTIHSKYIVMCKRVS